MTREFDWAHSVVLTSERTRAKIWDAARGTH